MSKAITVRPSSTDEAKAETAKRRRLEAFLKSLDEHIATLRTALDQAIRQREIVTTGQTSTRALVADFRRQWEATVGEKYLCVNEAAEHGIMRKLMKLLATEELRIRMARYFARADDFTRRARYSLPVFAQIINSLGTSDTSTTRASHTELERAGWFGHDDDS